MLRALAISSLLLCIAIAGLWVRNHRTMDWIGRHSDSAWHDPYLQHDTLQVISIPGSISMGRTRFFSSYPKPERYSWTSTKAVDWGFSRRLCVEPPWFFIPI
jgi:hypothetical protein